MICFPIQYFINYHWNQWPRNHGPLLTFAQVVFQMNPGYCFLSQVQLLLQFSSRWQRSFSRKGCVLPHPSSFELVGKHPASQKPCPSLPLGESLQTKTLLFWGDKPSCIPLGFSKHIKLVFQEALNSIALGQLNTFNWRHILLPEQLNNFNWRHSCPWLWNVTKSVSKQMYLYLRSGIINYARHQSSGCVYLIPFRGTNNYQQIYRSICMQ